jgi:O-antigen biosynthesis protein WbqV
VRRAAPEPATDPAVAARLLGRELLSFEPAPLQAVVRGRRVLVTGAGGTIGGELARLLARLGAAALTLIDHSERALFWVGESLREQARCLPVRKVLGSVTDRTLLEGVLAEARPELVFHAAACKHVALVEENPVAGVETNVIGTDTLLEACRAAGVARLLLVSTDKAAAPVSVMGATKRVAERLVTAAAPGAGAWASVRFGNVLGSSGSVLEIFSRRLAAGLPLEIRDPGATRYFMTVAEAGQLLVLAAGIAEPGDLLALEVGRPLAIEELARRLLREARPASPDVPAAPQIVHTRLGAGERLHESPAGGHTASPTTADSIGRLPAGEPDPAGLAVGLARLRAACAARDPAATLAELWSLAR